MLFREINHLRYLETLKHARVHMSDQYNKTFTGFISKVTFEDDVSATIHYRRLYEQENSILVIDKTNLHSFQASKVQGIYTDFITTASTLPDPRPSPVQAHTKLLFFKAFDAAIQTESDLCISSHTFPQPGIIGVGRPLELTLSDEGVILELMSSPTERYRLPFEPDNTFTFHYLDPKTKDRTPCIPRTA